MGVLYSLVMPLRRVTMDEPTKHQISLDGAIIAMKGRLVAKKIARDGSEAIRVAGHARHSVTADRAIDGTASYKITGSSRQNEEGVVEVCTILADRLRANGLPAGEARRASGVERGIDCEIPCGNKTLQVQVTRPATSDVWKALARFGKAKRDLGTSAAVSDLLDLVQRKARKTAPRDRPSIILAIDATETVVHAMDGVVGSYRRKHADETQAFRFAEVWVVGPGGYSTATLGTAF